MSTITDIKGIGPVLAKACAQKGFATVQKIAAATPVAFATVPGISEARGRAMINLAKLLLKTGGGPTPQTKASSAPKAAKKSAPKKKSPKPRKGKNMAKKDEKEKSKKKDDKKKKVAKKELKKKDDKKKSKKKEAKKKDDKKKKSGKKKK